MKNKSPSDVYITVIFFIILISSPINMFPQQANDKDNQKDLSEIMASNLKQKLLLTDEQTVKVKVILSNYINELDNGEKSSENIGKIKNQIESLLNDKQKAKYEIIKDDFFEEINKRAVKKQ